jgi:hypothetical protein
VQQDTAKTVLNAVQWNTAGTAESSPAIIVHVSNAAKYREHQSPQNAHPQIFHRQINPLPHPQPSFLNPLLLSWI